MKIVALVGALTVLLLAGCTSSQLSSLGGGSSTHHIVYYLRGSALSADLTLTTSRGGDSQQQGILLPLKNRSGTPGIRFDAQDGDFLYISAQNNGSGTMTCVITEDGHEVARNSSSGEFAIVTCSGSA